MKVSGKGAAVSGHRAEQRPERAGPALPLGVLQHWFLGAVAGQESIAAENGQVNAREAHADTAIDRIVMPSRHLSPRERVAIYHEAYRLRLTECLRDDYPAVAHALGGSAFAGLALAYISAHPSRSSNLNAYGRHLGTFCRSEHGAAVIATASPGACPGGEPARDTWRFVADLAELEWALV